MGYVLLLLSSYMFPCFNFLAVMPAMISMFSSSLLTFVLSEVHVLSMLSVFLHILVSNKISMSDNVRVVLKQ